MNARDMVLQRRLNYGFSGYEVPVVPRASRSARGRVPFRKKYEDNPVRAFEILASVASELLQETGSSAFNAACGEVQTNIVESIVEWEHKDGSKSIKADLHEQGTCEENTYPYVPGLQGYHQGYEVNEFSHALGNFSLKINPCSKIFDQSDKICLADQWPYFNERNAIRSHFGIIGGVSPHSGEIFRSPVDSETEKKSEGKLSITQERKAEKVCSAERWPYVSNRDESGDPFGKVGGDAFADCKPPAPGSPECNLKESLAIGCTAFGPFSCRRANAQVVTRDDEETSFGCTQPSATTTAYRQLPNIVDQRVGNLSAARNWKVPPKLKDWKRKQVYSYGRPCYTRQRSQRISPFKGRKLFDQIPVSASGGFQGKAIYNSPLNRSNSDNYFPAKGASPSVTAQQAPPKSKSRDCNVKLRIKSLKVPELFIEIPATATVGSLKRTVMEATTALLGDNLHVGILLQGKTVRDDSKTLLQTGICHNDGHRNLGFMLEPKNAEIMAPLHIEDPCLLSSGMPQDPTGCSMSLTPQLEPSDVSPLPPVMNMGSRVDNNINAGCSLADIATNNTMPDSQAMAAVPAITVEALSIVPFHRKSRHSEFVQRRTRRPFSISEVEALVQSVEKLGTGRWRDVKLCAFDSAKHRTYVDLKDKWKTLVHTARISPQQRRGEPVPQQLLDRVLAVHAYWIQHQAKQQLKIAIKGLPYSSANMKTT